MRRSAADSLSDSPGRKRQRLSSPVYDGSTDPLSQDEIVALDALEARLLRTGPFNTNSDGKANLSKATRDELPDDDENPFISTSALPGFASAASLHEQSSPDQIPNYPLHESDHDAWFKPASDVSLVGFQAASAVSSSSSKPTATLGFASAGIGFSTAGKKSIYAPSKAALAAAQAKLEAMLNEDEDKPVDHYPTSPIKRTAMDVSAKPEATPSYKRPAFRALENAFNSPKTPVNHEGNKGKSDSIPFSPLIDRSRGKGKEIENLQDEQGNTGNIMQTPSSTAKPRYSKQFVSPLITRHPRLTEGEQSTSAVSRNEVQTTFSSAASQLPVSQRHFMTPRRPDSAPETPIRTQSAGPRNGKFKPPSRSFVTPFKGGAMPKSIGKTPVRTPDIIPSRFPQAQSPKPKGGQPCFFDLTPPSDRVTLRSSGLWPQKYDEEDLDITLLELGQITPSLAQFYSFHTTSNIVDSGKSEKLGPSNALDDLKRRGCSLVTKPWIENHWSLILWKLSGMVLLNPEQEKDPTKRRWCWPEVIRQLLYRYERELNQGKRPALRKVTARDTPASFPMILCVSNIIWSEGGRRADGLAIDRVPELELTDGWYRLRASVDPPMARAIGRGVIRIGRKLGIAGARLSSERKEPSEVLEAYDNTKLVLSGNSSQLMPWHAKLGFQHGPCISTLHSLSPDGGCVAVVDIVVMKAFPVAYIEFFDDGEQKRREGPRNEIEETKLYEEWKRKREQEGSKLRYDLQKRINRFEGYIDRLERRAGAFRPSDDESAPENIDELYDTLDDPTDANATIAKLGPLESGWLARHTRITLDKEREAVGEQIEQELQKSCPPRDVRSFRVVVAQDACTRRRPANRIAQLTVWDALGLSFDEGGPQGTFKTGQRYLVTNLVPTQQSAWMNCEPGSEIYLSTRRDSRWTRLG